MPRREWRRDLGWGNPIETGEGTLSCDTYRSWVRQQIRLHLTTVRWSGKTQAFFFPEATFMVQQSAPWYNLPLKYHTHKLRCPMTKELTSVWKKAHIRASMTLGSVTWSTIILQPRPSKWRKESDKLAWIVSDRKLCFLENYSNWMLTDLNLRYDAIESEENNPMLHIVQISVTHLLLSFAFGIEVFVWAVARQVSAKTQRHAWEWADEDSQMSL